MKRPDAVRLWSEFAFAREDFPGMLRQLSEIGYVGVEAYGDRESPEGVQLTSAVKASSA